MTQLAEVPGNRPRSGTLILARSFKAGQGQQSVCRVASATMDSVTFTLEAWIQKSLPRRGGHMTRGVSGLERPG